MGDGNEVIDEVLAFIFVLYIFVMYRLWAKSK